MLTYPDFREKQFLVIGSEDIADLRFANENLVVEKEGTIVQQVSCHRLFAVFLLGEATLTTHLMRKCVDFGIVLICLRKNFEPYAVLGAAAEGNTALRKRQYELRDTDALEQARYLVENKTLSQMALLKKIREKNELIRQSIDSLQRLKAEIFVTSSSQVLLGSEGTLSRLFFRTYFASIGWQLREPRTRRDIPNFLLDIGYSYLFHLVEAMCRLYGFDLYHGVYHREFYARKSLVCDLMEPFRCIIDEALLKAYHLGQVSEKDFYVDQGEYALKIKSREKYSRIFFKALLSHKEPIYRYVQQYYRYVMRPSDGFPRYDHETTEVSTFPPQTALTITQ